MTLPSGKPLQQQVTQLARYDVLTGLPSRGVFLEAMEQAIARARRKSQSFAVLVRFKMPLELENDVAAILTEFGLPPQLLESELTESVLMEASREHNNGLIRLRKMTSACS